MTGYWRAVCDVPGCFCSESVTTDKDWEARQMFRRLGWRVTMDARRNKYVAMCPKHHAGAGEVRNVG